MSEGTLVVSPVYRRTSSAPLRVTYTLLPGASVPTYATPGSAGADLYAYLPVESVLINPGEWRTIDTGLALAIPEGFEAQVRSRSGLAGKWGINVLNGIGTVDSDYRGTTKVLLHNAGRSPFWVNHGDRIAQLVLAPVVRAEFVLGELDSTARGAGGFGSTGV